MNPAKLQTLNVTLAEGADGYVVAACREIPGCVSQGKTRDEALKNIADAIDACLSVIWEDWSKTAKPKVRRRGKGERVVFRMVPPTLLRGDAAAR